MDGLDPLPNKDAKACQYRDELAYSGLQSQTRNEYYRYETIDDGNPGLGCSHSYFFSACQYKSLNRAPKMAAITNAANHGVLK